MVLGLGEALALTQEARLVVTACEPHTILHTSPPTFLRTSKCAQTLARCHTVMK